MAETTPATILPKYAVRVQLKPTWAGDWRDQLDLDNDGTPESPMYLECLTLTLAAAPTMPEAVLKWDAGSVKREDASTFADYPLLDVKDWYVQVLLDELDPADGVTVTATHRMFVGVSPSEDVGLGGGGYGDQNVHALGLEYLLDRAPVLGSFVKDPGDATLAVYLDTPQVFNEKWAIGYSKVGNRSHLSLAVDPDLPDGARAYVFSDDGDPWTAQNIIEYLLGLHYDGDAPFALGGQTGALAYVPPHYDADGKTIYEVLNDLVDRRRGLGWCVRYGTATGPTDPATATIHVFTLLGTAVTSDATTIPANAEQLTLSLGETDQTIEQVMVTADTLTRYGQVVVLGEPVLAMFTLSFLDSTLVKGWTDADETDYKNAAGGASYPQNDYYRQNPRLRNVYQVFRPPDNWDWKSGDGENGHAKLPVNPFVGDDGTIGDAADGDHPAGTAVVQGEYRNWGRQLAPQLPIRHTATATEFDSEYVPPIVLVKLATDRWVMIDKPGPNLPAGSVRMLDNRVGFEVQMSPNHLLALNSWSGANASETPPKYDYHNLLATVAARTDQRLRVTVDIPYVAAEGESEDQVTAKTKAMAARKKVIPVEGAELWYCAPNTVIGTNTDGSLVRQSTPSTGTTAALTLRDDSAHLRLIGALAQAWYGVPRSAVTVHWARPDFDYAVGNYVTAAHDAWTFEPLNSVVTRKTFDAQQMSTTIETGYGEIDAVMAAGPMGRPVLSSRERVRGPQYGW